MYPTVDQAKNNANNHELFADAMTQSERDYLNALLIVGATEEGDKVTFSIDRKHFREVIQAAIHNEIDGEIKFALNREIDSVVKEYIEKNLRSYVEYAFVRQNFHNVSGMFEDRMKKYIFECARDGLIKYLEAGQK